MSTTVATTSDTATPRPQIGMMDMLSLGSIIKRIWKHAPKSEDDIRNRTPEVEAALEADKKKLQDYATKFGIPIDVMAYSDELLLGLQWLEPYFCEVMPAELIDEFVARCPNVAPLMATQPRGVWWIMGFFVPEPAANDPDFALKHERRDWICALLIEMVRNQVEAGTVDGRVLTDFVGDE